MYYFRSKAEGHTDSYTAWMLGFFMYTSFFLKKRAWLGFSLLDLRTVRTFSDSGKSSYRNALQFLSNTTGRIFCCINFKRKKKATGGTTVYYC